MSATILTGGGIFPYIGDRKLIVTADFELVRCVAVDYLEASILYLFVTLAASISRTL